MKAGSDVYALRSGGHSPPLSKNTVVDRFHILTMNLNNLNAINGLLNNNYQINQSQDVKTELVKEEPTQIDNTLPILNNAIKVWGNVDRKC